MIRVRAVPRAASSLAAAALSLAPLLLSACLAAEPPGAALFPAAEPARSSPEPLSATERAYVERTASVLFRGRAVERSRDFVSAGAEQGLGVCVRSRGARGTDHALLVLQRRIREDFIPQAADDILVLRSPDETAPCRELRGNGWIAIG